MEFTDARLNSKEDEERKVAVIDAVRKALDNVAWIDESQIVGFKTLNICATYPTPRIEVAIKSEK